MYRHLRCARASSIHWLRPASELDLQPHILRGSHGGARRRAHRLCEPLWNLRQNQVHLQSQSRSILARHFTIIPAALPFRTGRSAEDGRNRRGGRLGYDRSFRADKFGLDYTAANSISSRIIGTPGRWKNAGRVLPQWQFRQDDPLRPTLPVRRTLLHRTLPSCDGTGGPGQTHRIGGSDATV